MLKKVFRKVSVISSAMLIAFGLYTGCADVLDVNGEAGITPAARAAEASGSRIYAYIDAFESDADRVQFRLNNVDIKKDDVISFYFHYNNYESVPDETTLLVRDGKTGTKWADPITPGVKAKGVDWYTVSGITASTETNSLGFTFNGINFNKEDIIVIKEIKVQRKDTPDRILSFKESDWERWSKPSAMTFKLKKKLIKVATAGSTSWDQTNKFQFMIDRSVEAEENVSFFYKPCANATAITLRGVTSNTKWKDSEAIEKTNDWNYVEFKATAHEDAVGVTFYVTANSTNQTVHIKDFRIGKQRYNVVSASPYFASPAVINSGVVYSENGAFADEPIVIENPPVNIFDDSRLNQKSKYSSKEISGIDFLTAGPSHDMSGGITVSWQAPVPYSVLQIFESGTTVYEDVVQGSECELPWSTSDSTIAYKYNFYTYNKEVTGLKSGTEYTYKVSYKKDGSIISADGTRKFKTADNKSSFKCMVLSDLHRGKDDNDKMSNLKTAINAVASISKNTAFTIFNGDMVNRGFDYNQWKDYNDSDLLLNGTVAFSAGNHEYKPDSTSKADVRTSRCFFSTMAAVPSEIKEIHDAAPVGSSNYWFIYNRVLFIVTDSSNAESYTKDADKDTGAKQAAWIKKVYEYNKDLKNFDFIVALRHIPHYYLTYDKKSRKFSEKCQSEAVLNAYDYCGVDLVITSDHHAYNRSYPIKGKNVVKSTNEGSVYIVTPMTQGSNLTCYLSEGQTSSSSRKILEPGIKYIAMYDHSNKSTTNDAGEYIPPEGNIGSSVGGSYIEVANGILTFNYVARDNSGKSKVVDSVSIPKRSR